MAPSLQEQLLKAGVANKSAAKKARAEKRKQQKAKQPQSAEAKRAAEEALQAKKQRDRQLNQEQQAQKEARAINAQVKQLIDMNKQSRRNGDIVFNFTHDNKIKRLYVTQALHKGALAGKLAVVDDNGEYELVPMQVAEKILQRRPEVVVYIASQQDKDSVTDDDQDDWYADFDIPDDLTW
ncbi:DUF2058 domain-containing protein [Alteromonas oceanisediminis]|uniref:DUF2058 domain-containing protein n=1 Tax=Alteromonas oceanisediminis TaxID=2836180 RepID=UPI001BD9E2AF|nr:DUF2058 domain-containing protein [Alteromonas oceanisediminis]MBT0587213.1 DUF2058 family protein [Alteromonas oceanisediminis]